MICLLCGQDNRPNARFCDGCGTSLTTSDQDATSTTDEFAPSEGFVGRQLAKVRSRAVAFDMNAGAADVAEIISGVREKLLGLEPAPVLEPEQARFRLFTAITTFFKNSAQNQPWMLELDDLHWADRSSLLTLPMSRWFGDEHVLFVARFPQW